MKSHARVVIIGGGIMGVGLLYHLALEGWTDVVLIEKGELTSGSTWHAAGQCPHFNSSLNMTKVHVYGTELYPKLEELTGQAVSWHGCGGLRLATTDEEVDWLRYVYGISKLAGYEGEIIGPEEIPKYHPFLETFGIKAAFRTVTDGHVAPADVTLAMAAGARKLGAEIIRRCRVTNVRLLPSGEWLVDTEQGAITCEHVVNSAGSYADVVGAWTGHLVPISNMLHHYLITEPVKELIDFGPELPVVRDPYSHSYLREETNGILIGPYETATAHTCWGRNPPTWDFESELVTPELDRLMPWLEKAAERMPLFNNVGVKSVISAPSPTRPMVSISRVRRRGTELLDAHRRFDRHLPGRRRWQISRAMDGAWSGRDQHARIRSAPLRQLGDGRLHRSRGDRRLSPHVLLLQAGRTAHRGPESAALRHP